MTNKQKPTLDSVSKELEEVKKKLETDDKWREKVDKRQANTDQDIHHLQVEGARNKIILDGLGGGICTGGEKDRAERDKKVTDFLAKHYPKLDKVKVLRTVRLPGKNSKPGKVIVTLDSEKAVEEILHVTKPRNPTDGRDGVYVNAEQSRLTREKLYKKRLEKKKDG